ncbi:hypothetical protein CkaCkLH20_01510 [Colletotrichum karsti]|uniref:Uncharacterized protein n=1 Tax=Colletotrichum karsti TaxID=1095194 RepID=A0A9P6IEP9_9PEZI|nr:uncharacterized protein CkaCkLH20_01510 [Colletotrichum karsti]KAF9881360.1 hypothetical protein CkaCkLH20_01510 [Colletotrichum karsti]
MSGMHSTFSTSITGDKQHSYAVLSAIQQGSAAESSQTQFSSGQQHPKEFDAASVSSFGSSVSLLKDKRHRSHNKSLTAKKSSSLVARQRAAEDANAQVLKNQVRLSI